MDRTKRAREGETHPSDDGCIWHTVRLGQTLFEIAERYSVTPEEIRAHPANGQLPLKNDCPIPSVVTIVVIPPSQKKDITPVTLEVNPRGLLGRGLRAGFDQACELADIVKQMDSVAPEDKRMYWFPRVNSSPDALRAILKFDKDDIEWVTVSEESYMDQGTQLNIVPQQLLVDTQGARASTGNIPNSEYIRRRNALFPECVSGSSKYRNRAGDKLDEVFHDAMITEWLQRIVEGNQLRFVDVCGGPGAFSETLFKWAEIHKYPKVHGIGMTLKEKHKGAPDGWYPQLLSMTEGSNTFQACFGQDGTGNIYDPMNVLVMENTCKAVGYADVIVADGGFDLHTSGQEGLQEILSNTLILAECVVALSALKDGGCYVLKTFDTVTPFMISLFYLMGHVFEDIGVAKPFHSRIMNSERYFVGKGYRRSTHETVIKNDLLPTWKEFLCDSQKPEFKDKVPASLILMKDLLGATAFLDGVRGPTRELMERQLQALQRILDAK